MKLKIIICIIVTTSWVLKAQDVITKLNGDEIKVKIIETDSISIKYKKYDNLEGPTYSVLKAGLFMLKYENGTKEVFKIEIPNSTKASSQNTPIATEQSVWDNPNSGTLGSKPVTIDLYKKGGEDAEVNYTKYSKPGTATLLSTFLLGPMYGVIAPAIIASAEPSEANLDYPNQKLFEDPAYRSAYITRAHRIKRKKVWTNYFIGSGLNIVATVALVVVIISQTTTY